MHTFVFMEPNVLWGSFEIQKEGDHDSPRNGSPTWENQNKTNNEAQAQIIPLGKSKPMKKK